MRLPLTRDKMCALWLLKSRSTRSHDSQGEWKSVGVGRLEIETRRGLYGRDYTWGTVEKAHALSARDEHWVRGSPLDGSIISHRSG
ncbi:hypothetical protein Tco_0308270 [Tanacetum coccineum]